MKNTLLIHAGDDAQLRWRGAHDGAFAQGGAPELATDPVVRDAELVLVVPAQKVLLQDVAFAPHERRLLRQTVPYSLEEQLLDDVDTQHFALGAVEGEQVPVAVVDKQWLADWLAQCRGAGLDIKRVLPEQLLLPFREHCWTLLPEAGRWLVRVGRFRGFALEPDNAAMALQLLLDHAAELPQQLLVCSDDPVDVLLPQLPDLLRGIVEVLPARSAAESLDTPVIDLLQGSFARMLPWRRWWLQWQRPAIVFAAAVAVHVLVLGIQHYRLDRRNLELRQQIETVYREVEPRGVVNDPELQLRRKLQALQSNHGSDVLPLFQQVGAVLKSIDGVSVQNMTYSGQQGELRLSLTAAAFKDIEAVRVAIANTGLNAQLIGSNADGDKTRAQLRIAGNK